MLGCKLAVFVQAVCNMASDELCLKEGKVFAQQQNEIGKLTVERERLKAEFVKMLRRFPHGVALAEFYQVYEMFFQKPLQLVRKAGFSARFGLVNLVSVCCR